MLSKGTDMSFCLNGSRNARADMSGCMKHLVLVTFGRRKSFSKRENGEMLPYVSLSTDQ